VAAVAEQVQQVKTVTQIPAAMVVRVFLAALPEHQ
jgi:hypothetical protein